MKLDIVRLAAFFAPSLTFGPGEHLARCPWCYLAKPCDGTCVCEPDLATDAGAPVCSFAICATCKPPPFASSDFAGPAEPELCR